MTKLQKAAADLALLTEAYLEDHWVQTGERANNEVFAQVYTLYMRLQELEKRVEELEKKTNV